MLFSCNVLSVFGIVHVLVSQNELEIFIHSDFLSLSEIDIISFIISDRIQQ